MARLDMPNEVRRRESAGVVVCAACLRGRDTLHPPMHGRATRNNTQETKGAAF